jgi:hypothetical protein
VPIVEGRRRASALEQIATEVSRIRDEDLSMRRITTIIPTASSFLALSPRRIAGTVLALMNAASDRRSHPRTLRLDAEEQYSGPSAQDVGDLMAEAIDLMFAERFIVRDYRDAVDTDWFILTPKGIAITDPKQMDEPATLLDSGRPLVFVSCGQYTDEEKAIGSRVCDIIRLHTEYEPYFAEAQRSFEGLSNSILAALERMSGMVVIMHRRGEVKTPNGVHQRASVWVEQEIAIAASLRHSGRAIEVAAYIEDGIKREGLRDLLHMNPMTFTSSDQIARDFESLVTTGGFKLKTYTAAVTSSPPVTIEPAPDPFESEISETLNHAYGQSGLLVLSYICSMSIAIQPTSFVAERVPDERMRSLIDDAKRVSGVAFPIGATSSAANLNDGFEVTTYPGADGPRQYREYYRFRHDGLFVATEVSPDDIKEDRQYRESDRYIGFTTLVGTLTRMGMFASALVRLMGTEMKATFFVYGLANHRVIDDTADRGLAMGNVLPAHEDRVVVEFTGEPPRFEKENQLWSARVITHCLRLLNFPATNAVIEATVRRYQQRVQ